MKKNLLFLSVLLFIFAFSCKRDNKPIEQVSSTNEDTINYQLLPAPEWSNNATIYEVNLRQYTKEGTINAFIPHIQRLKKLGIDILWIMPPYPIGKEKRKGTLGSP
ncbi:MAG TPA: alpha-amylase, partial [Bacteroidetes bacterium]|nr:alpha-amylase [Bacteroidota bacterium]